MNWWIWVISGIGLLALELFIYSGFVIFFFGLSAITMGFLLLFGVELALWQAWLGFGCLALGFFFFLGRYFRKKTKQADSFFEEVKVLDQIYPGRVGRGEMRGVICSVRNDNASCLEPGIIYKVTRTEGITLIVGNGGDVEMMLKKQGTGV